MSVAKSSQAVTLAALALIAGYIAYSLPYSGPVSAGPDGAVGIALDWKTILQAVMTLLGGGAFASWQGWLGPILKVFQVISDNTKTNPVTPTTTDAKPIAVDVTPSPQQAIDDALLTVVKDALAKPTPAITAQLNGLLKAIADERFKIEVPAAKV